MRKTSKKRDHTFRSIDNGIIRQRRIGQTVGLGQSMDQLPHDGCVLPNDLLHQSLRHDLHKPVRNISRQRIIHQILDGSIRDGLKVIAQHRSGGTLGDPHGDGIGVLHRRHGLLRLHELLQQWRGLRAVAVEEIGEAREEVRVAHDDLEVVDGEDALGEELDVGLGRGGRRGLEVVGAEAVVAGALARVGLRGGVVDDVLLGVAAAVQVVEDGGPGVGVAVGHDRLRGVDAAGGLGGVVGVDGGLVGVVLVVFAVGQVLVEVGPDGVGGDDGQAIVGGGGRVVGSGGVCGGGGGMRRVGVLFFGEVGSVILLRLQLLLFLVLWLLAFRSYRTVGQDLRRGKWTVPGSIIGGNAVVMGHGIKRQEGSFSQQSRRHACRRAPGSSGRVWASDEKERSNQRR